MCCRSQPQHQALHRQNSSHNRHDEPQRAYSPGTGAGRSGWGSTREQSSPLTQEKENEVLGLSPRCRGTGTTSWYPAESKKEMLPGQALRQGFPCRREGMHGTGEPGSPADPSASAPARSPLFMSLPFCYAACFSNSDKSFFSAPTRAVPVRYR